MGYSDQQLRQLSKEEAVKKLDDSELQRYNNLKEAELKEGIEESKEKKAVETSEGLKTLMDAAKQDMTTTVYFGENQRTGLKVFVDPDIDDFRKIKKLLHFKDEKIEDLEPEKIEEIRKDIIELLAEASVNYSEQDWIEEFDDSGIRTVLHVAGKVLTEIDTEFEQKKRR